MVPHPDGQIGLESMKFRSEATGPNHFSALSANPMVSGPVGALLGSIFQDRFFKIDVFNFDFFKVAFLASVQAHPAPRPKT